MMNGLCQMYSDILMIGKIYLTIKHQWKKVRFRGKYISYRLLVTECQFTAISAKLLDSCC